MLHPLLCLVFVFFVLALRFFGRQTKKAIRGPNRPRMASMPLLSLVAQVLRAERNFASHRSDAIGCARTFRHARIYVPIYCVLAPAALSMQSRLLFYAGAAQMSRSAVSVI